MKYAATTFTQLIKEELCKRDYSNDELRYILSGFIKTNGSISLEHGGISISIHSENEQIARFLFTSIKRLYSIVPSSSFYQKMKLNKSVIFSLKIQEKVSDILSDLSLFDGTNFVFPHLSINDELTRNFIEGVFLASGSVNSPSSKNYHLQLALIDDESAQNLLHVLLKFKNDRKMDFKMIERKNQYILYLKKADQIATFLSMIFAHNTLLEFENERIMKDFINNDNRIQICYNANYKRTLQKAQEQLKEIEFIKDTPSYFNLSDKEQKLCLLRIKYPDESLSSLVNLFQEEYHINISKSGINHLFSKIHDCYLEVLKESQK